MKNLIFTIVFIILCNSISAQYKMTIKNPDNTTQDIWIHNITEITFTNVPFTCGTSTITYAGKTYNTVSIGTKCWLKQNLDIGTMINSASAADSQKNNGIIEKYCYNNLPSNCSSYGGLYQWNEAMQYVTTDGAKGICPKDWHIATYAEFQILAITNSSNALKEIGQGTGAGSGTNTSGFSALLAGRRYITGTFTNFGNYGSFWTSTVNSSTLSCTLYLYYIDNSIYYGNYDKGYGMSIRCVKD